MELVSHKIESHPTVFFRSGYKSFIIILHIVLGYSSIHFENLSTVWALGVLAFAVLRILQTKNKYRDAHYFAAYFTGLEVFLRMTKANLFWEFGKYSVALLLIIGLIHEKRASSGSKGFIYYFLLLTPGILLTDSAISDESWRSLISFNLSGPFVLALAGIYFYGRHFSKEELSNLFFILVTPLFAMIMVIYLKIGDLSQITFNEHSNVRMSGGFGPNQVSSILGMGVVVLILSLIFQMNTMNNKIVAWSSILIFLGFGLFTFSRGGIVAALFTILCGVIVSNRSKIKTFSSKKILISSVIFIILSVFTWSYVNKATNGFLEIRYKNTLSTNKKRMFSGRDELTMIDLQVFKENFLKGIGVGMSKFEHKERGFHNAIATHTEFTRLLAEHGSLGVAALLFLIIFPVMVYFKTGRRFSKTILTFFILYSLLTMTHAAMRIAMPGLLYGLAFIHYNRMQHEQARI